ncbi:hypothetical protein vseg_003369 [Gypsophila vaccaria]
MTSPNFLTIILCLFSLFISPSASLPHTLQLSLNTPNLPHSSHHEFDLISYIAKSTLDRAHHIKNHPKNPSFDPLFTPLFARSAGDYSISLSIGTPPQTIPAFFDTGSSLVWVPCTSQYSCSNCTTTTTTKIPTFKPRLSSSKKHINCHNTQCQWLDQPDAPVSCPKCNRTLPGDCTRPCSYLQAYGAGDTSGNAIFETLHFRTKSLPRLFVGCSLISDQMPEGIVGFGRNPMSLPNQLKLDQFSYCLVSHRFDDTSKSSSLVLGNSGDVISGVSYTPLLKNPDMLPFNAYYYVQLEQITINDKMVTLPRKALTTDSTGNGGTIVDSGSTLTSLAPNLFNPVANEYIAQLAPGQRNRVVTGESSLGNLLCVNVKGVKKMVFPEVVFHFKGGAKLDLPVGNYLNGGSGLLCLPFVNVTFEVGLTGSGPAVILGNYQQQNFYIEYDLKNQRLGFKKQIC